MFRYRLERLDLRNRIEADYASGNSHRLGEETRWLVNVPLMYRALAAPEETHEFIRAPQAGEGHPGGAPAYWGSLLHLLVYSFGWRDPGLGLRWWVDHGRPTDDPRFALIGQTWGADGQFDWFCAWLWSERWTPFGLSPGDSHHPHAVLEPLANREWFQQVQSDISESKVYAPYGGGTDPLHLWSHISYQHHTTPATGSLILADDGGPHGVLLADNVIDWYPHLHGEPRLTSSHQSGRSWRIDVVVKPVGWLGTFRTSRITGRFFAGPHRFHTVGNPTTVVR